MEKQVLKLEDCVDEIRRDMSQIKEMLADMNAFMNAKMATRDDVHRFETRMVAIETKVSDLPSLGKIALLIGLFATVLPFYFGLLRHFALF